MFYVKELKDIAEELDLDSSGTKEEVIEEIAKNVSPINKIFETLKSDELKAVCSNLRLPAGTKQDMVRSLLEITDVESHKKDIQPSINENLEPTFENVYGKLKECALEKKGRVRQS